jgi:hypothetical protein
VVGWLGGDEGAVLCSIREITGREREKGRKEGNETGPVPCDDDMLCHAIDEQRVSSASAAAACSNYL